MKISQRAKNVTPSLTLELTAKAKKMKSEGRDVVSFGAGEPDFNTPDYIITAAKHALDQGKTKYTPASGIAELKAAVADKLLRVNHLSYAPAQIVVSNGAKHSLTNAFAALVEEGDEVIVPAPFWLTYPELIRLFGGVPVIVNTKKENGFKLTADELKAAITPRTRAIVLNNPNNPTGAVYDKAELYALAEVLEKTDVAIVADEIYESLNYTGREIVSIATYSEKIKDQTIIINGVSKTYSMTGWRIGFTASNAAIAKAMSNMQSHMTSNPNSIAQYATLAAYTSPEGGKFLSEMNESFTRRRSLIMSELDKIAGLSYVKPDGAFYVLVDLHSVLGKKYEGRTIGSAQEFAEILLEAKETVVIPCESFGADGFIRLSYAISDDDIVKGVRRIGDFVANLKA